MLGAKNRIVLAYSHAMAKKAPAYEQPYKIHGVLDAVMQVSVLQHCWSRERTETPEIHSRKSSESRVKLPAKAETKKESTIDQLRNFMLLETQ